MSKPRPAKRLKFDVYGLPISVLHWEGPGPTVFCLHGWLDQAAHFEWIAQALRGRANLYALDFRGHGHSGWVKGATYVHMDYVMDVDTVYEALGVEKAMLLGHSMGGMVAANYAAAYPEKVTGVISLEGIGPPSSEYKDMPKHIRAWMDGYRRRLKHTDFPPVTLEKCAERLTKNLPSLPLDRAIFLARHGTKKVPGGYEWRFDRRHKERTPYRFFLEMVVNIWQGVTSPLVYVQGGASGFMGLTDLDQRLAALKPEKVITLPGIGHHLPLEAPEEIAAIVSESLDRWGL